MINMNYFCSACKKGMKTLILNTAESKDSINLCETH
jgi:DNA-directed RNA polymerase subunit RPC12/RpoP